MSGGRTFLRRRDAQMGLALIGGLALVAVAAAALLGGAGAPIDLARSLQSPSAAHWLGCDENGRDVGLLLALGARTALFVAVLSVGVSATVGAVVGTVAGALGGRVDDALMRLTEVVAAFPGILLALVLLFVTGRPDALSIALALAATGWAPYARLVRGSVLVERARPYVEAAGALGLPAPRVLFRHILPNALGPLVAQASAGMGGAMIAEASLAFLGFGVSGAVSWGQLLEQGATWFLRTPHLAVSPALAMMFAVLGFQLLGDALRDALDPRTPAT